MLQKPTYEELEKRIRELERAESERIKTEKALHASEANLARAQAVAKVGSWRLDIANWFQMLSNTPLPRASAERC